VTPVERQAEITARLQTLSPSFIEIIDESDQHRGHVGAQGGGSHFALTIVSKDFEGLSPIKRHQQIYQLVGDLIPNEVHALKINAKTSIEITS
jgi:BolA protein